MNRLVDEYRDRCLWFLRPDYYPATLEERLRVLGYIQRHGDLTAFRRASELRRCLSGESVLMEWARDSAFRFFPLLTHPDLGLTLHPFDLATNKVLALVGRLEVRDWIDVIHCDARIQPLGCLAWAACGKDPGFTPDGILDHAARAHYCAQEVLSLSFAGTPPDPADLSRRWRDLLSVAREMIGVLPAEEVGRCVLAGDGTLFQGSAADLRAAAAAGEILFHEGSIRGALPRIVDPA